MAPDRRAAFYRKPPTPRGTTVTLKDVSAPTAHLSPLRAPTSERRRDPKPPPPHSKPRVKTPTPAERHLRSLRAATTSAPPRSQIPTDPLLNSASLRLRVKPIPAERICAYASKPHRRQAPPPLT